ncbi:Glyco_trans_2-like domain-containing protein [Vibrio chagasii]|nr:Glyco_trans_2-like domain-containing protein [Vibrio chagasii]CAH7167656.1 Glyco_trans_2-like domain-containing protein [Vibrio chagasii]CAH7358738.1 Glyco_trans_2-like domain-containing protein [Vibrio chagasii]
MNDKELVSVIIPFYSNSKGLLISSVTSALKQSYDNIEVVVVDDCSPIKAKAELASISDDRLTIIECDTNHGGGVARNIGVKESKGVYVCFLDYDDYWYPIKVEKQLKEIRGKNPEKTVIYSKTKVISGNRSVVKPSQSIGSNESVADYIFTKQQIIQTSGIFLSRNLAEQCPFHDIKRHQDYQFCLALEKYGCTFIMSEDVLYEFVQIPKKNDYEFSAWWLEEYGSNFSVEARKSFIRNVVLRSMIFHHYHIHNALLYAMKKKQTLDAIKILVKLPLRMILIKLRD